MEIHDAIIVEVEDTDPVAVANDRAVGEAERSMTASNLHANHRSDLSFAKTSSHLVDNGRRSRDRRGNARRLQTTARERAAWAHPDPLQKEEELGVGRQSSRTEGRAYEPIGLDQAARRT